MFRFGRLVALLTCVLLAGVGAAAAQEITPLTYAERGDLARSQAWINRVQMATTAAAIQVLQQSPEDPGYTESVRLARYYLQQQEYVSQRVAWMVLVSDEVTSEISDQALTALIVSQWGAFSALLVS